ncbi:trypsin CFT-1-like [Anticarsia gemmatalis]|uniref:trypsin CFT-1-like n=1 Tax=Anticarsia gemmatalis TaxID=129554 RepID=UPI003F76B3D5
MRVLIVFILCYAAVSAGPPATRIVGGSVTTINNYPSIVALLESVGGNFRHSCGGSIMNQRSILTAAHCFLRLDPSLYRIRVGSTMSNSGGIVYNINSLLRHPNYVSLNSDIALMRTANTIVYSNVVQPARIAGPNYFLGDNEEVWAAGWGATSFMGPWSEQLRHVQIWTVNQEVCRQRLGSGISDDFLCAGWLDVGGRDQCQGDSGGPVYHRGVVVGVTSSGRGCGSPQFPGINMRVSRFSRWIQDNSSKIQQAPRIVGGNETTIDKYPSMVAILERFSDGIFQRGGGVILNQRSVLTAGNRVSPISPPRHFIRAGSSMANSGGIVYDIKDIRIHPNFFGAESDIAVVRIDGFFSYSEFIQPAPIAGPNYNLLDDEEVWVTGWGATVIVGPWSEQLRDVQVYSINQEACIERYINRARITENMLCTGILDVGGKDACHGDAGGPVYHKGVVVGITSFGIGCASHRYPGVNTRVSRFANWIQDNA